MTQWPQSLVDAIGIENRASTGRDTPGASVVFYVPRTSAGVNVNHDTALKYSAVWACIRVIAETLANMSWPTLKGDPDGVTKRRQPDHAVDWMLNEEPNPEMSAFSWRETTVAHALSWGNGYSEIERDHAKRPLWLWPIAPDRVNPTRSDRGNLVYEIHNGNEPNTWLEPQDMYHLKGLGFDGLVGYDVISLAAQSIGMGLATEEFGANFFGNGTTMGGVLEHPGRLGKGAKDYLEETLTKKHSGPRNAWRPFVLEEGMTWKGIGIPPEAAQFLESRDWQITDIARWFRVPLHKLAHLLHATFSNIEHQSIEFVVDTIGPWARRLEQEANRKLFGRQQRGTYFTRLNLYALLRGDSTAQANFCRAFFDMGVFSVNDICEFLDRNPIGPDGDKRLVQLNLTTLEKAGEQPAQPAPKPAQPPAGDTQDDDDVEQEPTDSAQRRIRAAHHVLFEDAATRMLKREGHQFRDAAKKHAGNREAFEAWAREFAQASAQTIRDTFQPAALALVDALAMPRSVADFAMAQFVEYETGQCFWRALKAYDGQEPDEGHRANRIAESFVRKVSILKNLRTLGDESVKREAERLKGENQP